MHKRIAARRAVLNLQQHYRQLTDDHRKNMEQAGGAKILTHDQLVGLLFHLRGLCNIVKEVRRESVDD